MSDNIVLIRCESCRALNRVPVDKLPAKPVCGACKRPLAVPTHPIDATAALFDAALADWPETVLVEFWAKWCGYCRIIEPVVTDLAAWNAGRLKVLRVDVDAEPGLAGRFTVKATPTFILFRSGVQLARLDGAPKEKIDLIQWVDKFLP